MATIDKISVRKQVEQLKQQFEQLRATGKVNDETQALMSSLLLIVELILSIFLGKKTRKNNRNSSIPSSQTDKDSTALPISKSKGNGKGKGKQVSGEVHNTRVVETVTVSKAETCSSCGSSLTDVPCHQHERRTRIDIVFEKVAEHVDAEIKLYPNCKSTVKGDFPEDMVGKLQYGSGLKAFSIHLIVSQMVALKCAINYVVMYSIFLSR
jgi:transposase